MTAKDIKVQFEINDKLRQELAAAKKEKVKG
jgi:hypothetical protein